MKKTSLKIAGKWVASSLSVMLLSGAAFYPSMVSAQSTQNFNNQNNAAAGQPAQAAPVQAIDLLEGAQQLPPGFAQNQVPPTFALGDDPAAVPTSDQIIPAQTATTTTTTPATGSEAVDQQPAAVPAQPETQRLVRATPMGTAAQSVGTGAQAPNPVEDAAAQADAEIAQQQAQQSQENVLDKYRAATEAEDTAANPDEALPAVNTTTMLQLEGDYPNSNKKVTVAVDGTMSPEESKALQEGIRQEAFDAAITGMFPLSPEQIKILQDRYDRTQRAVETPSFQGPRPEVTVQNMSLDPGVLPPTIKTAVGNVTTLNILDATGAPWPVQDVTWAGDFEIVEPEEGGHIIRITPMAQFARGNIVIRLLTLKTPLTLTLETSRDVVQYRVDARVPEYGPFASAPLMQGGKSMVAGDSTLTSLLDGVAPGGAAKLKVSGVDGRTTAYAMNGSTYVRTPLTLLSPAWQSSVSSADGMNVYVLSSAPVLLLSDEGEFLRATLNEKEDLLDE